MARKAKRPEGAPSPAVQEWIKKREAELGQGAQQQPGGGQPGAPAPGAGKPGGAPGQGAPGQAASAPRYGRRRVPRVETQTKSAFAEMWPTIRTLLIIVVFAGVIAAGLMYMLQHGGGTPTLGATEINQLRPDMTPDQVAAILGKPQSRRTDPGSVRESRVDRIERAKYYEYFRKGTLMLIYDKDEKLIEVCLGETSQEYYDRKDGKQKALWESYEPVGFIHQDVWRPNQD